MTIAEIHSLDYEGRGVARIEGKTVFVAHALPGERVSLRITAKKPHFDEAEAADILRPSPYRTEARCPHYRECGGCALQHADAAAQVAYKQRVFEEQLQRLAKIRPAIMLAPIYGPAWHYRHRARLAICAPREGEAEIGFQAAKSRRVVGIGRCDLLPEWVSGSLNTLRSHIRTLHRAAPKSGMQALEISLGTEAAALNIISRKALPEKLLHGLAAEMNAAAPPLPWQVWQQTGNQAAHLVSPQEAPPLAYALPEFGLMMPFRPGDFTQVNTAVNEVMVARAVRLLDPQPQERVADLFCGLGNFSLPLARSGAAVLGVEGAEHLTRRAAANARANGTANARFQTADLFAADAAMVAAWGRMDKMLLDPPRAGAYALVRALHAPYLPQRIVYVSCNPATLARDAAVLAEKGYRFQAAGIMNLFAQTAHIEAVGVFELPASTPGGHPFQAA